MFSIISFDAAARKFIRRHQALKINVATITLWKKLLDVTFYLLFTFMGAGSWVISGEYASVRKYLNVN